MAKIKRQMNKQRSTNHYTENKTVKLLFLLHDKRGYETIRVRGVVPSTCNGMLLVSVVINCQSVISPNMQEYLETKVSNTMTKRKRTKGQTTIYKTLHKKLKIDQHEPHQKPGMNSSAPEGQAVPAQLMAQVVLLQLQIR